MRPNWSRKAHVLFKEIDNQINHDGKITQTEFTRWAKDNQKRATMIFPSVFEYEVFAIHSQMADSGIDSGMVEAAVKMFFGELLLSGEDKDADGQLDKKEFADVYMHQMVKSWGMIQSTII